MEIAGTTAIVTGASSGIGEATAVELARRGAHVVAAARRVERLERTVARCREAGGTAEARPLDVTDRAACEAAVAAFDPDVVVNNAGISLRKHAARTTTDDIERVLAVNLRGAVYLANAALPGMLARHRGAIVNVSSVAGAVPNPREAAYGATKAALIHWTHGLALDLRGTGVHVGVVIPGPIDTGIWDTLDEEASWTGALYPPEEVARAVATVIGREEVQRTVPRRFGSVGALYPLLQRPMRWGLLRFDRRTIGRRTRHGP